MSNGQARPAYFDLRCLQDARFQYRGVGHHASALLRGAAAGHNLELIGLTDPALPVLPAEYTRLVSRVSCCWNPALSRDALFVSASPMTHDVTPCLRLLSHPGVVSAAVVYDFIPLDRDGYLPRISDRMEYFSRLAYLKQFRLFLPISDYSAGRLRKVLGIDTGSIRVTGASVRRSLYEEANRYARSNSKQRGEVQPGYFLTVGGNDLRKNTEVAVRAVRTLRELTHQPFVLKAVGDYGTEYAADLVRLATAGGTETFVEFCSEVSDAELVRLYAGAVATIAPSHIEGFSLPVVEAAVCGSPCVASTCAAHLELIDHSDALFTATDNDRLCKILLRLLRDSEFRDSLVRQQRTLGEMFHEDAVAGRFWNFLQSRFGRSGPAISVGVKPRVAFLTPFPPEESGVSLFSERTLEAAVHHMDIDLYTDAPRPISMADGVTDGGEINPAIMRRGPYDSIVSVLGNSHFHIPMFEIMEQFGGPCILHDSRLVHIYHWRLGRERFVPWAENLLRRPISGKEIDRWLHDRDLPSLFIEPILKCAEPLIVHTGRYQQILRETYGYDAVLTTFPPNISFTEEELSRQCRAAARRRLGISNAVFAIASFGYVAATKGIAALIVAIDLLRSWRIPAELFLVGSDSFAPGLAQNIAAGFGIGDYVRTHSEFVGTERYRDFMVGADAAVQLRTYDFGQPSAALADCICAGLPLVSNESLASACDAPSWVVRLPNHFSPLLIAEALATIYERRNQDQNYRMDERRQYLEVHNFASYAKKLTHALGFA